MKLLLLLPLLLGLMSPAIAHNEANGGLDNFFLTEDHPPIDGIEYYNSAEDEKEEE